MSSYVVDASVAAKWFLPAQGELLIQEGRNLLKGLRTSDRSSVPDLFWPEIGNIIWKAVRADRMSSKAGDEAVRFISEMKIPTFRPSPF